MMKFKIGIPLILLLLPLILPAQVKQEQEYRIDRKDFPRNALELLEPHLEGARRIRFYLERDGERKSYEAKFKKGKLRYSVEFLDDGELEDVEFIIGSRDIPNDSWAAIEAHLQTHYPRYRIKKIQQQHPWEEGNDPKGTLHQAFQNLILPGIRYELVFSAKMDGSFKIFEALYDATGTLIEIRRSLPLNYDHVLYP